MKEREDFSEGFLSRGFRDAWSFYGSPLGAGIQLVLSAGAATLAYYKSSDVVQYLYALVGFFAAFLPVTFACIARAPFKQRNEARKAATEWRITQADRFMASDLRQVGVELIDRLHPFVELCRTPAGLSAKQSGDVLVAKWDTLKWLEEAYEKLSKRNSEWGKHFEPPCEVPGDAEKMVVLIQRRMRRISDAIPPEAPAMRLG